MSDADHDRPQPPAPPAPADLDRLAELEARATPGPWEYRNRYVSAGEECDNCGAVNECPSVAAPIGDGISLHICSASWAERGEPDAELIAAMRSALPSLLAELRAWRATFGRRLVALGERSDDAGRRADQALGLAAEARRVLEG